ncbi:ATP-binding protein [Gottfriedia acidiceleris]|uniref:ATP-binding protein n=1 Tax=Gottfriedia acidiceleris TaxID=371036 RepID=UPI00111C01ED|nr:ATP-binding protein [Gottfriedia acidiceleris]
MESNLSNGYEELEMVEAAYDKQILEEFCGNPLIEALPPILTEEEIIILTSKFPRFNEKERYLNPTYRYHCIQRLFQYFQPFEIHLNLEQRISRAIRQGYLSRNPLNADYVSRVQENYLKLKKGELIEDYSTKARQTSTGFTIIGFSGIGKSTAIDKILSLYPKLIKHTSYKGKMFDKMQIPYLKIDCPHNGSLKGLCVEFFSAIDRVIGSKYFKKFNTRNNIDTLLQHIIHLAHTYSIGILIIDEIQHLKLNKAGGSEKMLNFFVTLVNTINLPVVMVGTNKATSILQSQFRQARRGSGQGDLIWNQMPFDENWKLFIMGMWDFQWTKNFTPLTEEINKLIYEESQGIIDIAVKIFMIAQLRAISSGTEKLTPAILRKVVKEDLKLVRPMLLALKSGIPSEINKYDDIKPIDMDEQMEKFRASVELQEKVRLQKKIEESKRNAKRASMMEEIVLFLLEMGTNEQVAKRISEKIIKSGDESLILVDAKKEAMKLLLLNDERDNEKRQKNVAPNIKPINTLMKIHTDAKKNKVSVYEKLREAGYIKIIL